MKINYENKVVLITGAGGAIGNAMAKAFAENGAKVAVCDVNETTGKKTVEEISAANGIAEFFYLDVSKKNDFDDVIIKIAEKFGGIDILVNNAGVNVGPKDRKPINEFDDKAWDWIIGIDLDGVFHCSKAVIPYIIERSGGVIINISSVVGQVPFRNQCAFAAAKAGVINLSKAMALELAPQNIRVNVIAPGSILMEGTKDLFYQDMAKAEAMLSHIPQHRAGSPEDIAYAALYLASSEAGYVTGSVLTVDGGWTCGFARDF